MTDAVDVAQSVARFVALHAGSAYMLLLVTAIVVAMAAARRTSHDPREAPTEAPAPAPFVMGLWIVVVAAALFATMTAVGPKAAVGAFDSAFAEALATRPASAASSALTVFFAAVTHVGDRATLVAVTIAVAGLLAARRHRLLAAGWLVACSGNGLLNPALKRLFERARPVHDAAYATVGEYSFPSGHTSGSVVVYGMLAYVGVRLAPRRWRPWIAVAAAAAVVTVASSRAFLRVHWASDVVAGFASGGAWLAVCIVAVEAVRRRAIDARR